MKKLSLAVITATTLFITPIAHAQDTLGVGLGVYDVFDQDRAADIRIDARFDKPLIFQIKPWAGIEATNDASVWAGGGLYTDIDLNDRVFLSPSIGAGLYAKGSSDKDLDYPIEFRTQLEVNYRLDTGGHVGVGLSHLSNADLGDTNEGTEVLSVHYRMPFNFFGKVAD
ncbi:MAG: acyloxyacyl hydrolase [Micavibrio sp.]|nr:acyloxyacyl hydrolase [Micavibrio sp.]|tara:strand:+ start:5272 stop:5778 length:507 start_codon:yes stop_codon:yes gene_type:complete